VKYTIKEIFGPTIQGEGGMTGTVCAFVRMAGCNMWDGRPETRAESECPFCDTDFYKGTKMSADAIVQQVEKMGVEWVTLSGGEPMLQLEKDPALVYQFHETGIQVAIETNGSIAIPTEWESKIAHLTVSPKQPEIKQWGADTLKILYPHPTIDPMAFDNYPARNLYIQPVEPPSGDAEEWKWNTKAALAFCYRNPHWKLSAQVHEWIDVK